jgi:hypothetical protein
LLAPNETPGTRAKDVESLDAILAAMCEVISGPAGQKRDGERFHSLFLPGARLVLAITREGEKPRSRVLDVEEHIRRTEPLFVNEGFWEHETERKTEQYRRIARAFSSCESSREKGGTAFEHGANSIQVLKDGTRWSIVSVMWNTSRGYPNENEVRTVKRREATGLPENNIARRNGVTRRTGARGAREIQTRRPREIPRPPRGVAMTRLLPGHEAARLSGFDGREQGKAESALEHIAQAGAGFVQLRLGIANGAAAHARDLGVVVALNVVEDEDRLVAGRQPVDGAFEMDAVNQSGQGQIESAEFLVRAAVLGVGLGDFLERDDRERALAEAHENHVDRQAVQPGGERRISAKRVDLAEDLQESFLREVLGFGVVADHAQAKGENARAVQTIEALKAGCVSALSAAQGDRFGQFFV